MKTVVANFKMNKTIKEIKDYISELSGPAPKARVMLALPCTAIAVSKHPKWIEIGAQNVHWEKSGAFTSEVSADQLLDAGATFTIVGHSERHVSYLETYYYIAKRAEAAAKAGLDVVFCVGENAKQHEEKTTKATLLGQLREGLKEFKNPEKLIVAYEPAWVIGNETNLPLQEIESAHSCIKGFLERRFGKNQIPVLYGGSVNEKNVSDICAVPGVDGVLVGNAALDVKKMKKIIEKIVKQ